MEWLCNHAEDQVCLNCAGAAEGEKVELEMLCQHGPGGMCTNCMTDGSSVAGRKHMSFEEFLKQRQALCDHSPSGECGPMLLVPVYPWEAGGNDRGGGIVSAPVSTGCTAGLVLQGFCCS